MDKDDTLFNLPETDWSKEWQNMPEFIQDKQKPFCQLIVRFRSQEDLYAFAAAIGQKLTPKTKSIWHPALVRGADRLRAHYRDDGR